MTDREAMLEILIGLQGEVALLRDDLTDVKDIMAKMEEKIADIKAEIAKIRSTLAAAASRRSQSCNSSNPRAQRG
jgi:hypothetical protein